MSAENTELAIDTIEAWRTRAVEAQEKLDAVRELLRAAREYMVEVYDDCEDCADLTKGLLVRIDAELERIPKEVTG